MAPQSDNIRAKLLTRVVKMMQAITGQAPDSASVLTATDLLQQRLAIGRAPTEKDLKMIAAAAAVPPTKSTTPVLPPIPQTPPASTPQPLESSVCASESRDGSAAADPTSLIVNTSKRQRKILADREWSKMAEEDRVNGQVMRIREKEDRFKTMLEQRKKLDGQMTEHREQQDRDRQMRERQKQQMTEHIQDHRDLTRKEKDQALGKAREERRYREDQHTKTEEERRVHRELEHEDHIRTAMLLQEQMQQDKQRDIDEKHTKQREWRGMLEQNDRRMQEKAAQKERERQEDRDYQRIYKENQERLERERAEFYARKASRQQHFQKLADGVAQHFRAKEQDLTDKIDCEYEEQVRKNREDDDARKAKNKGRLLECLKSQNEQIEEKKRHDEKRRREDRRLADEMAKEAVDYKRQEEARKIATRQEALRMRQFLNSQLQMAHFKETQEPETSIMRPPDCAATMYSPERAAYQN